MWELSEGQSLGAYGMVELDDRARSMAFWVGNPGTEVRVLEVSSSISRGRCWTVNSESAVLGILVLSLVYGLKKSP